MKNLRSTLLIIIVAMIVPAFFSSCHLECIHGSGKQISQTRKPGRFSAIKITGSYKLILKQDSSYSVTISADDNLLPYITTGVSGDQLRIYSERNFCSSGEMTVTVGVADLRELKGDGAIEVYGQGKLNVHDILFGMAGSGKIDLDLNAQNVITEGSGSTTIHLVGQAASYKVKLSGGGTIKAFDFIVSDCELETAGSSDCEVNVLKNLQIKSAGSSDIKYKGSPNISESRVGASSITKVQ